MAALDGVEGLVIKAQADLQGTLLISGQDLAVELLVLDVHHGEAALFVACAQLGEVHLDAGRHAVEADGLLRHAGAHRCDRLGRLQDEGVTLGTGAGLCLDVDGRALRLWSQDLLAVAQEEEQQQQQEQQQATQPPGEGGRVIGLRIRVDARHAVELDAVFRHRGPVVRVAAARGLHGVRVTVVVVVEVARNRANLGEDVLIRLTVLVVVGEDAEHEARVDAGAVHGVVGPHGVGGGRAGHQGHAGDGPRTGPGHAAEGQALGQGRLDGPQVGLESADVRREVDLLANAEPAVADVVGQADAQVLVARAVAVGVNGHAGGVQRVGATQGLGQVGPAVVVVVGVHEVADAVLIGVRRHVVKVTRVGAAELLLHVGPAVTVDVRVGPVAGAVAVEVARNAVGVERIRRTDGLFAVEPTVVVVVVVHDVRDAVSVGVLVHGDEHPRGRAVLAVVRLDLNEHVGHDLGRCAADRAVVRVEGQARRELAHHGPGDHVAAGHVGFHRRHGHVDRQVEFAGLVRDRDLEVAHVIEQVADAVVVRIVGHIFSVERIGRSALRFVHVAPAVVVVVGIDRVGQAVVVEVRVLVEHGDGQVDRRPVQVVGGVDGVDREVGDLGRRTADAAFAVDAQAERQVRRHVPRTHVRTELQHLEGRHRRVDRQEQFRLGQHEVNRAVVHVVERIAQAVVVDVIGLVHRIEVAVAATLGLLGLGPTVAVIVVVRVVADAVVVGVHPLGGVHREGVHAVVVAVVVAVWVQAASRFFRTVEHAVVVVVRIDVVRKAVVVEVRADGDGQRRRIVRAGRREGRDGVDHRAADVGRRAPQGPVRRSEVQARRQVRRHVPQHGRVTRGLPGEGLHGAVVRQVEARQRQGQRDLLDRLKHLNFEDEGRGGAGDGGHFDRVIGRRRPQVWSAVDGPVGGTEVHAAGQARADRP